ncbi:MAG: DUF1464 family protein [Acidobacteria bacterium]|nr:DUF1464 family protein [Acidobacteriota bacterium]MDW7983453.1 DUF1464 family protein [Acidobacteriota bacterium]
MRVLGIDPGTVSFDVCGLDDGQVFLDLQVASPDLSEDPSPLIEALTACGPVDLIVGPSGYGLPLVRGDRVGEQELALIVLVRADDPTAGRGGILGLRRIVRTLIATGRPVVFVPGVIHLPTVPVYRKANRIDMGTADKVCSAALGIYDQARRYGIPYTETSFILLEIGGAFTAALAVEGGRIVDGLGGTSGPLGLRGVGAMDGEVAYLIGGALSKGTLFSGGAMDMAGAGPGTDVETWPDDPRYRPAWLAWIEGAVKAIRALTAVLPRPREILLSGRMGALGRVLAEMADRLSDVAPVRRVEGLVRPDGTPVRAKEAAQGAALLADGLAGGPFVSLVEAMELRRASGTVLDYLYLRGAEMIRLGS